MYSAFELLRDSGTGNTNAAGLSNVNDNETLAKSTIFLSYEKAELRRRAIYRRRSRHDFKKAHLSPDQLEHLLTAATNNIASIPRLYKPYFRVALLYRGNDGNTVVTDITDSHLTRDYLTSTSENTSLFIQSEFNHFDALVIPWADVDTLVNECGVRAYMDVHVLAGRYLESVWLDVLEKDIFACMIAGIVKHEFREVPGVGSDATPLAGLVLGNGELGE